MYLGNQEEKRIHIKKNGSTNIQSSDLALLAWHIMSGTEITIAKRTVLQTKNRTYL
jgi:hypothetical protein